jgi:ubiquinone biosynthesis protein UbiJ
VFSQGGRLVPDESEASLDENSSVAEGEDSLKAVRADVRRLEGKLDKLLTAIESRR